VYPPCCSTSSNVDAHFTPRVAVLSSSRHFEGLTGAASVMLHCRGSG
jgi:hypothetical protein